MRVLILRISMKMSIFYRTTSKSEGKSISKFRG